MAHGELYMLGAFFAYLGAGILHMPIWAAIPFALVLVFFLAMGIERVALKPLRKAPHFIPLVSTIAVSTILTEGVRLAFGPYNISFDTVISNTGIQFGPLHVSPMQLFILALSLILMTAVQLFLTRSKWGRAIRGTAQDTTVSGLLGINANRVIGVTFAISSVLGAVAGILIAMYFGAIYPSMGFVALIKAFTAAILGGMGSVPGAVLGGFVLGIAESLGSAYLPSGLSDALPYVLLFVALLFLPGGLTGQKPIDATHHGAIQTGRSLLERLFPEKSQGDANRKRVDYVMMVAIAGTVLLCCAAPFMSDYVLRVLTVISIYAMMALGINFILGLTGQLSLSHAAFFAIGAYSSGLLTTRFEFGFAGAMIVGALISAALGALVSLATFRVRGYYLALVTLAFAEIVRVIIGHWNSVTGGMMGVRGIPAPTFGPWVIDSTLSFFYLSMGVCIVAFVLYDAIAFSVKGRSMMAVRDDELAARASGLPVLKLKIAAFTLSAIFPAVGGSLMAHYYTAITPDMALMSETVSMLVIVVIGGLGSAAGAVFGAAVINLLPEAFRNLGDYRLLVYGAILLVMVLFQSHGVFSIGRRLSRRA
ncbi:MAG: transporter permease protein, partial [Polaromonas sp.]|nr:transporter permease protein [Polaromonas sp.]